MKTLHVYEVLPNSDPAQDYRDILVITLNLFGLWT